MAAAYCYEGIPLRFLASLFYIQMRYLVYMGYLWSHYIVCKTCVHSNENKTLKVILTMFWFIQITHIFLSKLNFIKISSD